MGVIPGWVKVRRAGVMFMWMSKIKAGQGPKTVGDRALASSLAVWASLRELGVQMDDAHYGQVSWAGPSVAAQPAGCAVLPVHAPAALPSKTQNACGRGQGPKLPNLQSCVQGEAFVDFVLP